VTGFTVSAASDGTGKRKASCSYGYAKTGLIAGYQVPWTSVQFYSRTSAGAPVEIFQTMKTCVASSCQKTVPAPPIPASGAILGCRIVKLQDGAELKDAITTNNQKETFVATETSARGGGSRSAGAAASGTSVGLAGVTGNLSGSVKQCQTSLSASVAPQPQQFLSPQNGPADFAPGKIILHLQSSATGGNSFTCRYASHGKDIPDFAVTVQCPNAAPRAGAAHSFTCSG
jgi:hypothetical protein